MPNLICRIKEYIQPFERHLALEELRALTSGKVTPIDGDEETASIFAVADKSDAEALRGALAYWHSVGADPEALTTQLRSEATSISARNGVTIGNLAASVPELIPNKLPNRRCLRYATHGLHEYRGKFFPQLVRALMNMAQVPKDGIVLDPMCGSGTTLVEACLSGRAAYGLDMNPLSVFIADVKCQALGLDAAMLVSAYQTLAEGLGKRTPTKVGRSYLASLPDGDQEYLSRWFAESTLLELDRIESAIRRLPLMAVQRFFSVCLSNILRGVSWQKNDDLRVRKEVSTLAKSEIIARFVHEALRSTKIVAAFLAERGNAGLGRHFVLEADARSATKANSLLVGQVDAVITSPPYATALPYLDTDRLSLIYLGLLPREDHRARDTLMIGNREITKRGRAGYWAYYEENRGLLPKKARFLIERIDHLNKINEVGFRRRNLSALLSNYFFDMREVLDQQHALLRPGGVMFMVIGNNRTTAGGEEIEIRTAEHLVEIAEGVGFRVAGNLSMEMLVSRDIFRKNAMPSEQIVTLQKPQ